jgi:hypothetical protein
MIMEGTIKQFEEKIAQQTGVDLDLHLELADYKASQDIHRQRYKTFIALPWSCGYPNARARFSQSIHAWLKLKNKTPC